MDTQNSFDYQYFYQNDSDFGLCTCGLARDAAATVIAQKKHSKLYDPVWISNLHLYKDRPSALGFLVELTCLSCIADFGLNFGDIHLKSTAPIIFYGNLEDLRNQIPSNLSMDFSAFYIPHNPQFEDIDALYFQYKHQSNVATVIPIQVTISKRHTDSEWFFYKSWDSWKTRFHNYTLTTTFVWIVENKISWDKVDAITLATRQSTLRLPDHHRAAIPVGNLHQGLGTKLAEIRPHVIVTSEKKGKLMVPRPDSITPR